MPFIQQQTQKIRQIIMIVLLVLIVVATLLIWYFGVFKKPKEIVSEAKPAVQPIPIMNVESMKKVLDEVRLNIEAINDPFFVSLKVHGEVLRREAATPSGAAEEPVSLPIQSGRSNPFLPY